MATGAVNDNSQDTRDTLVTTGRALFIGLLWAALMLLVYGYWMRSKHEGAYSTVTSVFFVSAAVAAALAGWQAFTLWFKQETPEQKTATLNQQQNLLSYILLAAGLGLMVMAFVLGLEKKAGGGYGFVFDNFAESFGALLFGLISLIGGYILQQPERGTGVTVDFLVDKVPILKLAMLIVSVAAIGTLATIYWKHQEGNAYRQYLPEMALLLFISVTAVACFFYLNTPNLDESRMRLLVLAFGGSTGVLLFLWSIWRTIVWRNDIFLGGATAWQGENAYRFWVCAYVLVFSLALMFFSFNLARADIRKQQTLRIMMYGYDALVQTLLLLGTLYILNVVVFALIPFTYDWTKSRGLYPLSESSKNLIAGLKQETNIIVLLSQNDYIYKDVRVLLDNCQAMSNRLKVEYVSPNIDDKRYEDLAELFPKIVPDALGTSSANGILLVAGPMPRVGEKHSVPSAFVAAKNLFEAGQRTNPNEKAKFVFKGEPEIIRELKFLVEGKKNRKIYILQGSNEPDMNNMGGFDRTDVRHEYTNVGIGLMVQQLKKDNFEVAGLSFGLELKDQKTPDLVYAKKEKDGRKQVPLDCATLMVAGVTSDLPKETLDAIEDYLERGGKALFFLDIAVNDEYSKLKESNLEGLLGKYGVEVTKDVPLRFTTSRRDDPRMLYATTPREGETPLAREFVRKQILMERSARVVKPKEAPGRYKGEVVLHQFYHPQAENRWPVLIQDLRGLKDPAGLIDELREDPLKRSQLVSKKDMPLAVAVTDAGKPRMVVFGDTDFITNREIVFSQRGLTSAMNYGFVLGAIDWMAERSGIGAQPKESPSFSLSAEVNDSRMVHMPAWLMLLGLITLGVCVWVVRRK